MFKHLLCNVSNDLRPWFVNKANLCNKQVLFNFIILYFKFYAFAYVGNIICHFRPCYKAFKLTRWCLHLTAIYRNVPIIWYSPDYPTSHVTPPAWSSVSVRTDHSQSEDSIMHTNQSEATIMHMCRERVTDWSPHYADRFIRLGNFLLVNHESNGPKLGRWREESSAELMRKKIYEENWKKGFGHSLTQYQALRESEKPFCRVSSSKH